MTTLTPTFTIYTQRELIKLTNKRFDNAVPRALKYYKKRYLVWIIQRKGQSGRPTSQSTISTHY